jgi:hypothetical protein
MARNSNLKGNLAVVEPTLNPPSEQADQTTTYSTDTRSSAALDSQSNNDKSISDDDLNMLAKRWWE